MTKKEAFYTYKVTQKALRSLILNTVDDQYINDLKDKDAKTKYSKVPPMKILMSLWKYYGTVEACDLSANEARMKAQ